MPEERYITIVSERKTIALREYDLICSDEWKIRKYPCTGRPGVSDDDDASGDRGEDRGRIFAGASRLPCGCHGNSQRHRYHQSQ